MTMVQVSYDLNSPGRDYEPLYKKLKAYSGWAHPMDSMWVVYTAAADAAQTVASDLLTVMDKNDTLFTSVVHPGEYAGWLTDTYWNWLSS